MATLLNARSYSPDSIEAAAALLRAGKLVILPTETVYGIGLNLESAEARSRVKSLKNLSDRPHWVLHVPGPAAVLHYLPELGSMARRVLHRAWPGPVSFQFRLTGADVAGFRAVLGGSAEECLVDSFLTLRCPDNASTLEILDQVAAPIAIVAAGLGPLAGPREVGDVPEPILTAVDAVVDSGPTRYHKSSTLVRVNPHSLQVIRPGVIDERIIQRMADYLILFVCTGNTCRSPMAAALAQDLIARKLGVPASELAGRHIVVQSAGLHAMGGMRATREAVAAMRERSLDIGTHIAQPVTLDLLRRADVIFTMTEPHRLGILRMLPGSDAKVHRLDPHGDVDDPVGSGEAVYRQTADNLDELIRQRLDELVL